MRSAFLKWARAGELQHVLARGTREHVQRGAYSWVKSDNAAEGTDPLLWSEWRLAIREPYPERWSVLIGDIVTNLRAALDHALWFAVNQYSGPPANPNQVTFPIAPTNAKMTRARNDLASLVSPDVWDVVDALQPYHGGTDAYMAPLEILRWLSNADKHRQIHLVGMTSVDFGPIDVEATWPVEIVEEWRHDGLIADGDVAARLVVKRPVGSHTIDTKPVFGRCPAQ